MAVKRFISLENLTLYDSLIKQVISDGDAASIKSAALNGKKLELYTIENPTAQDQPRFSITLPFTQQEIIGANGKATIFNESDGGGSMFTHNDGTISYLGSNDGGENGLTGQLYTIKKVDGKSVGTRLNMTLNGFYYTNGANSAAFTALDEIATKRDVQGDAGSKTVYLKDESSGQSEYAKVYKLYQGADAEDMSHNTFVGAINLPKDLFIKSASIETVTEDDEPYEGARVGDKYIDIEVQNQVEHIYVPVKDLVDVYTGGITPEITISIDNNNVITATINNASIARTKLNADVNSALSAGESALQPEDIGEVPQESIEELFN